MTQEERDKTYFEITFPPRMEARGIPISAKLVRVTRKPWVIQTDCLHPPACQCRLRCLGSMEYAVTGREGEITILEREP